MTTPDICIICKSPLNMITDPASGEIFCSNCGMVICDKTEESGRPEWRNFEDSQQEKNKKLRRTGRPLSLARHDIGLYTIIGQTDKDARGQKLDVSMRSSIERLRRWDYRSQVYSSTDRNLMQAFNELDRLKYKLGLSDAIIEKLKKEDSYVEEKYIQC